MKGKNKTVTLSTIMMLANGFGITFIEFLKDKIFFSIDLEIDV